MDMNQEFHTSSQEFDPSNNLILWVDTEKNIIIDKDGERPLTFSEEE